MGIRISRSSFVGVSIVLICPIVVAAAELPTAEAILQIHRANKEKLSRLHLQLVHTEETTEASCRQAQQEADQLEKILEGFKTEKPGEIEAYDANGMRLEGEALLPLLMWRRMAPAQINELRSQTKPFRLTQPMEFFTSGADYQFRAPAGGSTAGDKFNDWIFATKPVTAETLRTTYREVSIFSRSAKSSPAARWWHGSVDGPAYIMQKNLQEVWHDRLPPYTDITRPGWDTWHPYDGFYSQAADKYRVVRQEDIDGRVLSVVDVAVSLTPGNENQIFYRAWLDLKRGAVLAKVFYSQGIGPMPEGFFDRTKPSQITTTHEVVELPNGGYYPATTVRENWEADPQARHWGEKEGYWIVPPDAPKVVFRRETWDCGMVETPAQLDDNFFVLRFPEGQKIYDHDAGKIIGGLESQPLVKVGQPAPPLSISRWLDGKPRTLADFKGQVVVLDFWGLWCSACRNSVPRLNSIQERFQNQPVTFISIHTADSNLAALATQIEGFKKSTDWHYIAAIDKGRMLENSETTYAYGVTQFPFTVVVGPDGKIAYVEPHFDDAPTCDEEDPTILAEFEKKVNALMKGHFEAVGEPWPIADELDDKEQQAIYSRVEVLYLAQQIEQALKTK